MNYIKVNCQVCTEKRHIDTFFQCVCEQPICNICMLQLVPVPKVINFNLSNIDVLSLLHSAARTLVVVVQWPLQYPCFMKSTEYSYLQPKGKSGFNFTNFKVQKL